MVVIQLAVWLVAQGLSLVVLASLWVAEAPLQAVVALLVARYMWKLFEVSKK
jgi:hypothetical protein